MSVKKYKQSVSIFVYSPKIPIFAIICNNIPESGYC